MPTEVKAPRATASQRRAERMADRADAWRTARALIGPEAGWYEGFTPEDVLELAKWLAGDGTD